MKRLSVTKEMTFDCAHMLSQYKGQCNNLHGHTYKVQVTVGFNGDTAVLPDTGMLMDFKVLKEIMDQHIKNTFDHTLVLSGSPYREKAEEDLYQWAITNNKSVFVLDTPCTAEFMALHIRGKIWQALHERNDMLMDGLYVNVRLWETPTSFAEVDA